MAPNATPSKVHWRITSENTVWWCQVQNLNIQEIITDPKKKKHHCGCWIRTIVTLKHATLIRVLFDARQWMFLFSPFQTCNIGAYTNLLFRQRSVWHSRSSWLYSDISSKVCVPQYLCNIWNIKRHIMHQDRAFYPYATTLYKICHILYVLVHPYILQ